VDRLVRRGRLALAVTEFSKRVHRGLLVPPGPGSENTDRPVDRRRLCDGF